MIFWYREYPKAAVCPQGDLPRNSAYPQDAIFAYALLSSPATVTIDIGVNNHFQWDAPAGGSIGQVPFPTQGELPNCTTRVVDRINRGADDLPSFRQSNPLLPDHSKWSYGARRIWFTLRYSGMHRHLQLQFLGR